MVIVAIAVFLLGGILVIYKKTWFLKLHVHNFLGYLYDLKQRRMVSTETHQLPKGVLKNADRPLSFRSCINDTQNVHPKVLYFKDGFGGHKYWMAYTPFPWYIDYYENPCIAYSDDGYEWTNIEGNPIDNPNGEGYDSDPHLVYIPETGILECWYRHVGKYGKPPVEEVIHRRTSKDGIHWSEDELLYGNYSGKYAQNLSPAILWDGQGYRIWSINKESDFKIEYHEMKENGELNLVREYELEFDVEGDSTQYKPWHLDVIKEKDSYVLLVMCKEKKGTGPRRWDLFMTVSKDNVVYSRPKLVLHGTKNGWDKQIYRSSIVNTEDEYRIYYSALNDIGRHGMGITVTEHIPEYRSSEI